MSPSRRPSRRLAVLVALSLGLSAPAGAQQHTTPIVVVDQERLFQDSRYGQRVLSEIDDRSAALAAENRGIEARLVAEESELTELRATLSVSAFRARADDFDTRVEALRDAQDAKGRDVARFRDEAQQRFYLRIGEVLTGILAERDAQVLLDRRSVLSVIDSVDITDLAIARIDAAFGAGELPDLPAEEDAPAPPPADGATAPGTAPDPSAPEAGAPPPPATDGGADTPR